MRYTDLLIESHEYAMLLETPQREAWLIKNFGEKVEQKFHEQFEQQQIPETVLRAIFGDNLDVIAEIEAPNPKVQKAIIEFIMKADPTPNKAYARWIVIRYLKNGEMLEDMGEHLAQTLGIFSRAASARRIDGNIDAYKTFNDLTTACEPFLTGEREVSSNQDRKAKRNTKVDTRTEKMWEGDPMLEQSKVVHDDDEYMILIPETAEAAAYFGKNTHWCTTTWAFERYSKDGPLIIILRRQDSKRWQFHFESQQFMDELDRSVNLNDWIDENPKAFDVIGVDKFAALIGQNITYGGGMLSMRHFSPEVVARQPAEVLVRTVSKDIDIDHLPADKAMTTEFFEALLNRIGPSFGAGSDRYSTTPIDRKEAKKIIARYVGEFGNQKHYFDDLLPQHLWLLKELPKKLQTDFAKETLAHHLGSYLGLEEHVPKPWNEKVQTKYWFARSGHDTTLRAVPPKMVSLYGEDEVLPEKFQTDQNIIPILARHPIDIKHFEDRLTPDFCRSLVGQKISNPVSLGAILDNLPERCLTKDLQLPIYKRAMELKLKGDADRRDSYLACLTRFHNDHWPWKASKVSGRMATVNPKFYNNPEQFHTHRQAMVWVDHHPDKLSQLGKEMVTEDLVRAALLSKNRKGAQADLGLFLDDVLDPCDPEIVKPEWVAPAISELGGTTPGGLSKFWQGIPKKYMTDENIEALLDDGSIGFDHEHFPKEDIKGHHVLARFNRIAEPIRKHRVTKEEAEKALRKKETGYLRYGHEVDVVNVEGLREVWKSLPAGTDRKEALKALFDQSATKSHNLRGGTIISGKDFHCMVNVVEKEYLDDPEVLSAWLEKVETYGYVGPDPKILFKAFPKSAYTAENMALAVEKGIVKEVPEDLQDDNVIVNMFLKNSYGDEKEKLDFSKLTPSILISAYEKDGYDFGSRIRYATDKQQKTLDGPLSDLALSLKVLKKEGGSTRSYGLNMDADQMREIYGTRAQRRVNWNQECYDLAAGDIVALKDIPEKFHSDKALFRAAKTTNDAILEIEDREKWLSKFGDKLDIGKQKFFLSYGIARTTDGWVDFTKHPDKRTTVKGAKGSYVMTKLVPKGEALMLFDKDGKAVNAITVDINIRTDHWGRAHEIFANGGQIGSVAAYRDLIIDAFEKNPEFNAKVADKSPFESIHLYTKSYNTEMIPVEKWERNSVKDSKLTFVAPKGMDGGRWSSAGSYYMFDGNGPLLGKIALETSGRGVALQYANLFTQTKMKTLIECSDGFTQFLSDRAVNSGQNPTFKGSVLHTMLGIRGPGGGVWFSLLEEKVHEEGDFTVWTSMGTGSMRVSVAHAKHGILTEAKKLKGGDFSITFLSKEASGLHKEISALYEKVSASV
jgi:hypothetical protein